MGRSVSITKTLSQILYRFHQNTNLLVKRSKFKWQFKKMLIMGRWKGLEEFFFSSQRHHVFLGKKVHLKFEFGSLLYNLSFLNSFQMKLFCPLLSYPFTLIIYIYFIQFNLFINNIFTQMLFFWNKNVVLFPPN